MNNIYVSIYHVLAISKQRAATANSAPASGLTLILICKQDFQPWSSPVHALADGVFSHYVGSSVVKNAIFLIFVPLNAQRFNSENAVAMSQTYV